MINNKKVIGIVGTFNLTNPDNDPYKDNVSFVSMYYDLITACGAIPIGILDRNNVKDYLDICDGYLWPGGGCIQRGYNIIFENAIKNHKPILGICLGLQAINTYFSVVEDQKEYPKLSYEEVYQKLKNDKPYLIRMSETNVANHDHYVTKDEESIKRSLHKINLDENGELFKLYQNNIIYEPSMHTIMVARIPSCLKVNAKTDDGIVEGIEYINDDVKILGVQYHPELIKDIKPFEWLVNNIKKND